MARFSVISVSRRYVESGPSLLLLLFTLLSFGEETGLAPIKLSVSILFTLFLGAVLLSVARKIICVYKLGRNQSLLIIVQLFLILSIVIRAFSPALVRQTEGGKYKVWDLDNLFFVSIARSIIVYGNVNYNLGILGEPINYHTAPSFLIASLSQIFYIDPLTIIYLLDGIFALTVVLFGIQLINKLSSGQLRYRIAFLIALNLPFWQFREDIRIFLPSIWQRPSFTFDMMFGSLTGILLLISYGLIIYKSNSNFMILYTVCISLALLEVKPQYFPALIIGTVFSCILQDGFNRKTLVLLALNLLVLFSLFTWRTLSNFENQIPVIYSFTNSELSFSYIRKLMTSSPSIAAIFLLLALSFFHILELRAAKSLSALKEIKRVLLALMLFFPLTIIVSILQLEVVEKSTLFRESSDSFNRNDEQLLYPFMIVVTSILVGALIYILGEKSRFLLVYSLAAVAFSLFIAQLHLSGSKSLEDFADLKETKIASLYLPKNQVILTNDFSFPAENFRRNYQGYLNSLSNSQFYFAMPPVYSFSNSWPEKFSNSLLFFGSNMSESHLDFLTENRIGSLFYSKRCSSPLIKSLDGKLPIFFENSSYAVYNFSPQIVKAAFPSLPKTSPYEGQTAIYGISTCEVPLEWRISKDSSYLIHRK